MAQIKVNGKVRIYHPPGTVVYHKADTPFGTWVRKAKIHGFKIRVDEDRNTVGVDYEILYLRDAVIDFDKMDKPNELYSGIALLYTVDAESIIPKPRLLVKEKEITPEGERGFNRKWG